MSVWIVVVMCVGVGMSCMLIGFRLGFIAGLDRAEAMINGLVEKEFAHRELEKKAQTE